MSLAKYEPRVGDAGYRYLVRHRAFEHHLRCGMVVAQEGREGLLREWARVDNRLGNLAQLELKRREALDS